jgi:hypothetical protein
MPCLDGQRYSGHSSFSRRRCLRGRIVSRLLLSLSLIALA